MLFLKAANFEDVEKESFFVAAEPADENGFTNDFSGISLEDFKTIALPRMIDWSHCRKILFPRLFIFSGVMRRESLKLLVSSACVIILFRLWKMEAAT